MDETKRPAIPQKLLKDLKGYQIVGRHSAVKLCLWLKKSLRNMGVCYKQKFYGISSHRCLQMTPALFCNQNCIYCWRPLELLPGIKGWDSADFIAEESIKAQRRLLSGFGGMKGVNERKLKEAYEPNQVAISLIGEPTWYPYLDELVDEYKARGMTTFVVTNGTNPEMVERIEPYQLYISLTAYSEESHLALNRPPRSFWDRVMESLKVMAEKDGRRVIRLTLIKGYNMNAEKFAPLIEKASPDFIEAKAYMHLGYSRLRLPRDAMPEHADVKAFAEELARLTGYEVKNESEISRVVLLERE
ncbi:4-demethylwyosine synthase TYW1 [Archaeoglobus veneficus]|uniref:S-adenosyl-L-methionine-dependent tRNA 4-demethylwyosine synthase n=1 Tax=Archaeoglobus veneficus (strain DSM 11195 / SNP6) TaxID=693661 RepID=F2KT41_ARCVS|nr:4-demethylwyosine synthase TYW1 [Archaeoglobus veneficus]AEA47071.1 Wyosine base formation domain-containing protein [Archaeoglobus veneficus SNP6]